MLLTSGARLGSYEIVAPLGAGGMGEVYRARDNKLGREIALKILPESLARDPERIARFRREAQTVAALNHPGIVTIYSVEEADGAHFLTMELVEGKTLAELNPKEGWRPDKLVQIAISLADAVSAAHQRGITHRDLKPANVMLTPDGRLKVLDFGLAKLNADAPAAVAMTLSPTQPVTGEGRIVGTVAYMSPEQAEGKAIDQRSDVFSLGIILYEMATGERPFKGGTSLSVLSAVLKDTPRALTEINPALPRDLWRIVRHCLAKDPEHRYQTAKDLRNDLEDLKQSLDSGELPAGSSGRAPRRRWTAGALGVAAIALLAAAVTSWLRPVSGPSTTLSATHRQLTKTEDVKQFPNMSPDGRWVVFVSAAAGNDDIYLQSTTGLTAINLTKDAVANDTMPAFSPDGESIAFRSEREGGGLFVMGRTGESVRRLTRTGFYPSWFPDGQQIVFSTGGPSAPEGRIGVSEVWVADMTGGEPRRLLPADAVQPRVSPHGLRIAYWSLQADAAARRFTSTNRDIWTVDMTGMHAVRVTDDEAIDWNPVWSSDGQWLYFLSNRGGSMNLWRIAISEASGITHGEPEPVTAPAPYVAHFSMSADGRIGAYASTVFTSNIGRIAFDARSGTVKGVMQPVTAGPRDFTDLDVTTDKRFVVTRTSSLRGHEDLYIVSVDGGMIRQLTNDSAHDRYPVWLPDNQHILFSSDRGGTYELWSIDADGGSLHRLTKSNGLFFPLPSRDGTRVAISNEKQQVAMIYDIRDFSRTLDTLPPMPDPAVSFSYASDWSPDGRSIAIGTASAGAGTAGVGSIGVWVYSLGSRDYRRVTDGAAPEWLADGRRLLYEQRGRISIVDVASGISHEVFAMPGESLNNPQLTADNSQLFFTHSTSTGDIWIVDFSQRFGGR